jgi:hypothetical protein
MEYFAAKYQQAPEKSTAMPAIDGRLEWLCVSPQIVESGALIAPGMAIISKTQSLSDAAIHVCSPQGPPPETTFRLLRW